MAQPAKILYCRCAYAKVIAPEVKDAVLQRLTQSGVAFEAVPICARCPPGAIRSSSVWRQSVESRLQPVIHEP